MMDILPFPLELQADQSQGPCWHFMGSKFSVICGYCVRRSAVASLHARRESSGQLDAGFGASKHLAEAGYSVTLIDASPNPGGLSAGWRTPQGRSVEAGIKGFWYQARFGPAPLVTSRYQKRLIPLTSHCRSTEGTQERAAMQTSSEHT